MDGTVEPVYRSQNHRRKRGQGKIQFPSSTDYEKDFQPYSGDTQSPIICDDHTTYYLVHVHNKPLPTENY